MYKNFVQSIGSIPFDTATLNLNFQAINPGGLEESCFLLRVINDSNVPVLISYDGINAGDYVRAGETLQINAQTNSVNVNSVLHFRKGTTVFVAGNAGMGDVVLAGYYQPVGV